MIYSYMAPTLKDELGKLKSIIKENESKGKKTVIFCEDRLTLVAERAVCDAVGGTFNTAVYTFARFLKNEGNSNSGVISSQGSAMAIRAIIEAEGKKDGEDKSELHLFNKFSLASSAQSIYDTIAILYASCVDIEELGSTDAGSYILNEKLHDIAFIYGKYREFLEKNGKIDRNMYLRSLPEVINKSNKTENADIVILGYQAFTGTMSLCVQACMEVCAKSGTDVYGLFTGGAQDIYANEANIKFCMLAEKLNLPYERQRAEKSTLVCEAEHIRQNLFDPQCFARPPMETKIVHIFEGLDEVQELEFIAANIKKHVIDGKLRYAQISVMLPSADYARGTLARVFNNYKIPYYVDERHSLESHPLTQFICGYLDCKAGGCAPADVCSVAGSFLFGGTQKERDVFRNYILRCASYRGGVERQPSEDVCKELGFDYGIVTAMRTKFLGGLGCLRSDRAKISDWAQGIAELMQYFDCEKTLEELAESASCDYSAQSKFYAHAYKSVMAVVEEAVEIVPFEEYDIRQYKKLIKSGFAAAEISLIPPKTDAVFVGDITTTVNAGSEVLFACGLTDGVPPAGADTALLTDREITAIDAALKEKDMQISPKISQVNRRTRETVALNLCAFNQRLYLSYPAQSGGQEQTRSEIISYISGMFVNSKGKHLPAVRYEDIAYMQKGIAYYCSEQIPALNWLAANSKNPYTDREIYDAVKTVVEENGGEYDVINALKPPADRAKIDCGRQLFTGGKNSVSPSLLETYFSCPYKNFLSRGLKLSDREEGATNSLDTGNIVHAVLKGLQPLFASYGADADVETERQRAADEAEKIVTNLLNTPAYSVLGKSKSSGNAAGGYMADSLVAEVREVAAGACEQMLAGSFRIESAEKWYDLPIGGGLKVGGKVDRIDSSAAPDGDPAGQMVRVIDYKTGHPKVEPEQYYAGVKLQLPLYLSAAKVGRRAAGAYYFPANIDYEEAKGVFTLKGFMDVSADVVSASDKNLTGGKSEYVDVSYGEKTTKTNMARKDFDNFLGYSSLIAKQGADEIFGGYIAASPYKDECDFCTYGGMCGFSKEKAEYRKVGLLSGADIAKITQQVTGGNSGSNGSTSGSNGSNGSGDDGGTVVTADGGTVKEDGNGN